MEAAEEPAVPRNASSGHANFSSVANVHCIEHGDTYSIPASVVLPDGRHQVHKAGIAAENSLCFVSDGYVTHLNWKCVTCGGNAMTPPGLVSAVFEDVIVGGALYLDRNTCRKVEIRTTKEDGSVQKLMICFDDLAWVPREGVYRAEVQ